MPDPPRGVFTLSEAAELGWTRHAVERAVHAGRWQRVARGVYLVGDGEVTPWLRALALHRSTGGVASHLSAARVHRLWVVESGDDVTVPRAVHRRSRPGVRVHRADLPDRDICNLSGVPVTAVARTCLDIARSSSRFQGLSALDSALRAGSATGRQLTETPDDLPARVAQLVSLADARSESALETGWRLALHDGGIRLTPQIVVFAGGRNLRVDLGDPASRVGLECDGKEVHGAPEAIFADRWRANALAATGWTLIRATWWDLFHRREAVIAAVAAAMGR